MYCHLKRASFVRLRMIFPSKTIDVSQGALTILLMVLYKEDTVSYGSITKGSVIFMDVASTPQESKNVVRNSLGRCMDAIPCDEVNELVVKKLCGVDYQ